MAVSERPARPAGAPPEARRGGRPVPRREREEEVLVWPDLLFPEFISAVLFTFTFVLLSVMVNAPLLDRADPNLTPNPSKAPWYFLNLQELLLHMHPAIAGVYVPTVALIALAAIPYIDRSNEGQGVWFGTRYSVRIAVFSALYAFALNWFLVLFNNQKHVQFIETVFGVEWPSRLNWLRNLRSIQTEISWPEWMLDIRLGGLFEWVYDHIVFGPEDSFQFRPIIWFESINFPALLVETIIPVTTMVGLSALLPILLWRMGWVRTTRDVMIALFSAFISTFVVLTVIGTFFRGQGMELVWPTDVWWIRG